MPVVRGKLRRGPAISVGRRFSSALNARVMSLLLIENTHRKWEDATFDNFVVNKTAEFD